MNGRIAKMASRGEEKSMVVSVTTQMLPSERDRLNSAYKSAGYRSRGEFARDAILDAVEQVEEIKRASDVGAPVGLE